MPSSAVARWALSLAAVTLLCLAPAPALARTGAPPASATGALAPLDEVAVLELEPVDREALLAEDEAAKALGGPKPLRFASAVDLDLSLATAGTWEPLADGARVWRLRVHAPGATDLNFGFARFALAPGATLHVWSEERDYFQGPYTSADAAADGQLWTPVVPGERAVVELFEPAGAEPASELALGRVGRGYRDLFGLETAKGDQGSCNVDVICPEGDDWRDEIRSVAGYGIAGQYWCTGSLVMNTAGDFTPLFLTAYHCECHAYNGSSIVAYWNYESPTCGRRDGGSLADNQSGATLRAGHEGNDMCLWQLDEDPDPSSEVYFSGFDARSATVPQATVGIHHPSGGEKSITFNDDPISTGGTCSDWGPSGSHWYISEYELGTTEGGSSGSGLWDPATHLVVGHLHGGQASCSSITYDCYGRLAASWDGASPDSRLKDWLDPGNTGTRFAAGSDPGGGPGTIRVSSATSTDSCSSGQGNDNGVWEPGETVQLQVSLSASGSFTGVQGTLTSQTSGVTVTDGSATWPNLSSGVATPSNSPHFTVQVGSGVACGTAVSLQLQVSANEGGPYAFAITGEVGATLEPDVPMTLVDNGTATSSLVVGQSVTLSDVNVGVEIEHSWVGDLVVELTSPAGTTVTLLDRPGYSGAGFGCSDDNMDVTFDDAASTTLENHCEGTTPWYSGSARPTEALSAFTGQNAAGTWTLSVRDASGGDTGALLDWQLLTTPALAGTCQACGGGPVGDHVYVVGGIAHAPGAAGTNWRSKLSLLNRSGASAQVTLDYVRASKSLAQTITLANGQLRAWDDVAVDLFGVTASSSGAVKVSSTQPLVVTARTYNQGAAGTYGQFLPGVEEADALTPGTTGVITMLAKNGDFRTNVGFVNLGTATCQVRVTLRDAAGAAVGSPRTVDVPAGGWKQDNDIFTAAGAGTRDDAYATVEVLTAGCEVWGYGSVVDNSSGDPTTVPIVVQ